MRLRTVWDWRLRLYPLVVIPALVWVNFVAERQGRDGRTGKAADEIPAVTAAPLHGFHNGTAVTCFTHPKVTLCYQLLKERR